MKKKKSKIFIIIFIFILMVLYILLSNKDENSSIIKTVKTEEKQAVAEKHDIIQTLTAPAEVKSAKEESLKLNTNLYYSTICAEENEIIKEGANLLKYTNGTYLVAPYDCLITDYYVPTVNSKCTSSNYIKISSISDLYINIDISEDELSKVSVGQEVSIIVNYDDSKLYSGTITKINETGTYSNGKTTFAAIVSLVNDGNLKIGMSANCTVIIEKNEGLLCVPIQAVTINNDKKYVYVKNSNDEIEEKEIQTGKSDANFVEILSGIIEGENIYYTSETVEIEKIEEDNNKANPLTSLFGGDKGGRKSR